MLVLYCYFDHFKRNHKIINLDISAGLIPISGTSATFNGCGSYDITVDFSKYNNLSGFNSCCNKHDICYNSCSRTKSKCDFDFLVCLNDAVKASNATFFKKLGILHLYFI